MVKIISASLDEETLEQLEALEKNYNFNGRSETIRAAISSLENETKKMSKLQGIIEAAMVVSHAEKETNSIIKLVHQFQLLVQSQVHHHLNEHKCVEVFVIKGEAKT
ncbi:MAG: ribbon-helix-helix protein, CopG family [Candidatus Micrarchaeota archaeon]